MGAKRAAASARAKRKPMAMVALPLQTKPSLPLLLSLLAMMDVLMRDVRRIVVEGNGF
jgi:hypothetical protein